MSSNIEARDIIIGTEPFWHRLNSVAEKITRENNPLVRGSVVPPVNEGEEPRAGWDVEPSPLLLENGKPSGYSILRATDDGLPVGRPFDPSTYHVLTNAAVVRLVEDSLANLNGMESVIKSVGSVRNRGRIFIAVYFPQHGTVKIGHREFKCYLNFLSSHDKSAPFMALDSSTCTVCDNTFRLVMGEAEKGGTGIVSIKLVHKKNMGTIIKDVPKILEAAIVGRGEFAKKLTRFEEIGITVDQARQILAAWIGDADADLSTRAENTIERMTQLFSCASQGNKGQTALDLFSAATDYYSHESAGGDSLWKQFESSEFGDAAEKKEDFFRFLWGAVESSEKLAGIARVGEKILVARATKLAKK